MIKKMIVILLTICFMNPAILPKEECDENYTTSYVHPLHPITDEWSSDFYVSFYCVNVNMDNSDLEKKINDTLTQAQVGWISKSVSSNGGSGGYAKQERIDITLCTDGYLSLYTQTNLVDRRTYLIHDGVTVEMTTGVRVFLNDIIDLSEECLDFLRTGEAIIMYSVAGEYANITDETRSEVFNYSDDFKRSCRTILLALSMAPLPIVSGITKYSKRTLGIQQ